MINFNLGLFNVDLSYASIVLCAVIVPCVLNGVVKAIRRVR